MWSRVRSRGKYKDASSASCRCTSLLLGHKGVRLHDALERVPSTPRFSRGCQPGVLCKKLGVWPVRGRLPRFPGKIRRGSRFVRCHANQRGHPGICVRHPMLFHPVFRCQAPDGVLVRGERGVDVRVAHRREDQIA
jgi:hypothetical protein